MSKKSLVFVVLLLGLLSLFAGCAQVETSIRGLNSWGVRPFLSSVNLVVKTYMPGEILSFVDGQVEGKTWYQTFNLGKLLQEKPVIDIEVIAREK